MARKNRNTIAERKEGEWRSAKKSMDLSFEFVVQDLVRIPCKPLYAHTIHTMETAPAANTTTTMQARLHIPPILQTTHSTPSRLPCSEQGLYCGEADTFLKRDRVEIEVCLTTEAVVPRPR